MTISRTMACLLAIAAASAVLLTSCNGKASKKETAAPQKETVRTPHTGNPMFIHISAPASLTDNAARTEYILSHYWDKVSLRDSLWINSYKEMDMAIVRFLSLARANPDQKVSEKAIRDMVNLMQTEATPKVYDMMSGILDKYLYGPNSELRNDRYYTIILNEQLKNPNLSPAQKATAREKLHTITKSRQ